MSDNAKMDDELAAFTDNLLGGRDTPVSEELEGLSHVVRQLHAIIAPDVSASPAFRTNLTQRLTREWNVVHQRQSRFVQFYRQRSVIALAASFGLVILAVALLSLREGDHNEPLQGTALGSLGWGIFIIAGTLIMVALLILWFRQRKKH